MLQDAFRDIPDIEIRESDDQFSEAGNAEDFSKFSFLNIRNTDQQLIHIVVSVQLFLVLSHIDETDN